MLQIVAAAGRSHDGSKAESRVTELFAEDEAGATFVRPSSSGLR